MIKLDSSARTARPAPPAIKAQWGAALLLALAARPVALPPALTAGSSGSAPAVSFPHRYAMTLIATLAVTAAAYALGAYLAARASLLVIPLALACWALIRLGLTVADLALGHAHLTDWGSCRWPR